MRYYKIGQIIVKSSNVVEIETSSKYYFAMDGYQTKEIPASSFEKIQQLNQMFPVLYDENMNVVQGVYKIAQSKEADTATESEYLSYINSIIEEDDNA